MCDSGIRLTMRLSEICFRLLVSILLLPILCYFFLLGFLKVALWLLNLVLNSVLHDPMYSMFLSFILMVALYTIADLRQLLFSGQLDLDLQLHVGMSFCCVGGFRTFLLCPDMIVAMFGKQL